MIIHRLDIRNFRSIENMQIQAHPHLNMIQGLNGAGKSTILEAMHLMAYGRSFRGRPSDGLIRQGTSELEVFVEWVGAAHVTHRAGLRHGGREWTGRLDGETVSHLGELCAALAVVTFEPGSHQLITGGAEGRRRFLDWGLFHVEHQFLPIWRRYARALKQRNAALKQNAGNAQLEAWDQELAAAGTTVNTYRQRYLDDLKPLVADMSAELAPDVQVVGLEFSDGWKSDTMDLTDALLVNREKDRILGYTSVGPHRADFMPTFAQIHSRDHLSRGQAKLAALAVLLGQAQHLRDGMGTAPVIALDDIGSELDANHQERVFAHLRSKFHQVWVTSTGTPLAMDAWRGDEMGMFHVEHGRLVGE